MRIRSYDDRVQFSPDLAAVLGFESSEVYKKTAGLKKIAAPNAVNLDSMYDTLYVYCDLCENRIVGDSDVPCLYNVPVRFTSKTTTVAHEAMEDLNYVPVRGFDSDVVEIDIRRRDGEPVPFKGGDVVVAVHLRKRRDNVDVSNTAGKQ